MLDPPSPSLFNNFKKETDEESRDIGIFAQMEKQGGCNL